MALLKTMGKTMPAGASSTWLGGYIETTSVALTSRGLGFFKMLDCWCLIYPCDMAVRGGNKCKTSIEFL